MPASMPSQGEPVDQRNGEAADRAHHHHALDAEIEHAGALDHQFADGGDQQRRRCGDDGEQDGFGTCPSALALRPSWPVAQPTMPDPVVDERVAGEHEEQQHALEHARDLVGHAERDLRRLAAEIGQRQHEARQQRCRAD